MRVVSILLLLVLGCGKDSSTSSVQTKTTIIQGPITIKAGDRLDISFNVNEGFKVQFNANFQVVQGGSLDIYAYLLTDYEMTNYKNGNQFFTLYSSGRVTVSNTGLVLSPGNYHFLLSNEFSVLTDKVVNVTVTVE